MRFADFAIAAIAALNIAASAASGFELEAHKTFPVQNAEHELRIISTADIDAFEPIIRGYQAANPTVAVDYSIASSTELMKAVYDENAQFDLAISSAMDLQTKIANDGLAQTYRSPQTDSLPDWAKWRDLVFSFTQEPAVLVVSQAFFADFDTPKNRDDLIRLLREHPEQFRGKVGTYDVRSSGLGYLFATQESRNSENYWRLTEVIGRLQPRLYCCSSDMISDVANGRLAMAYNVLGSYAESRLAETPGIAIIEMDDFQSVMLRTVLIPGNARNVKSAQEMVDYLVTLGSRPKIAAVSALPPINADALSENDALRPIRLGPGLLVFLDRLKRDNFIRSWTNSMEQK